MANIAILVRKRYHGDSYLNFQLKDSLDDICVRSLILTGADSIAAVGVRLILGHAQDPCEYIHAVCVEPYASQLYLDHAHAL